MGPRTDKKESIVSPILAPIVNPRGSSTPIKVQKSKQSGKKRNNVKTQGRPRQLSTSQMRKLIRLYLFTNLQLSTIRELVLCFGQQEIKESAIYTRLRNTLGKKYDHIRPRGSKVIQHRLAQFGSCKSSNPSRKPKSSDKKELTQVLDHYNSSDEQSAKDFPWISGSAFPTKEVHSFQDSDVPATTFGLQSQTPHTVIREDNSSTGLGNGIQRDVTLDARLSNEDTDFVCPQDLMNSKDTMYHPFEDAVQDKLGPFQPSFDLEPSVLATKYESAWPSPPQLAEWDFTLDELFDNDLSDGLSEPKVSSTSRKEVTTQREDSQVESNAAVGADVIVRGIRRSTSIAQATEGLRESEDLSYGTDLTKSINHGHLNDIDQTHGAKVPTQPSSQRLQSRLSKFVGHEKSVIYDVLTRFSTSTCSTLSISRTSAISMVSIGRLSSVEATAGVISEAQPPFVSQLDSLELPGDFILSKVNTFYNHIACASNTQKRPCMEICDGCFSGPMSSEDAWKFSIPSAVMKHKRGQRHLGPLWTSLSKGWSDKFGNTALHIAAGLGADVQTLSLMCHAGLINCTNTAGQTFMHLLAPEKWSSFRAYGVREQEILELVLKLKSLSFHFARTDIVGETFFAPLSRRTSFSPEFWQRLLLEIGSNGNPQDADVSVRLTQGARQLSGQCLLDQLPLLRKQNLDWILGDKGPSSHVHRLIDLLPSDLIFLKNLEDDAGKNCLHILADPSSEPREPDEVQQRAFEKSKLSLASRLLKLDFNPNLHDRSGETPLMVHIRANSQVALIQMLLNKGASINARNQAGESALHIAIKFGRLEATRVLLDSGAHVHARNIHGEGVLSVGYNSLRESRNDEALYGKITACLMLAMDAGAVAHPNACDEWSLSRLCHSDAP